MFSGSERRRVTGRRALFTGVYGSSAVLGLGVGLYGVVRAEMKLARRAIGPANERLIDSDGTYGGLGTEHRGAGRRMPATRPLRLLVLGDSAAAGYGMVDRLDTPAGLLGTGLAHISGRPVQVCSRAFVGARSRDLAAQLDAGTPPRPSACVIVIGTNDVAHSVRPKVAAEQLAAVVRRLTTAGVPVVVGTCPDLGALTPLQVPLRQVARAWARQLARRQTIQVTQAGGRAVSLGSLLGPDFSAAPGELFGADRFHPSLAGYAGMSAALLPSVAAALGYTDEESGAWEVAAGVLPVSFAAARATRVAGTETVAVDVDGSARARGRWVRVLQRPRVPQLPGWRRDQSEGGADGGPTAELVGVVDERGDAVETAG